MPESSYSPAPPDRLAFYRQFVEGKQRNGYAETSVIKPSLMPITRVKVGLFYDNKLLT